MLNPETITVLDPACGSGHILVVAYDVLKAIYLERGYRPREIPRLILEKNLFGLDIDGRAAQLTGFALMMKKGRADDRRLFERDVKLNVMALVDSAGFDAERLAQSVKLGDYGLNPGDLTELKRLFEHATTFGSLIQVPEELAGKLPALRQLSEATSQDLFVAEALKYLEPLVRQAELLAAQYDAVVANPPYMGSGGMNARLKTFAKNHFPEAKSDLFACFIERSYTLAKDFGSLAMVTMQSWMFLSSLRQMRERMLREKTITTMAQISYNSFPSMNSKVAQATMFSLVNNRVGNFAGTYVDLNSAPQAADKEQVFLARNSAICFDVSAEDFEKIPGSPVAYWASEALRDVFFTSTSVSDVADPRQGLATGNNDEFLRLWNEVSIANTCLDCLSREESSIRTERWYPCQKGGPYRRWYGNHEYLVDWQHDGRALIGFKPNSVIRNPHYYFKEGGTWSSLSSSSLSMRYNPAGFIFESKESVCFPHAGTSLGYLIALSNSAVVNSCLRALSPTLDYHEGPFGRIPFVVANQQVIENASACLITLARNDWNAYERSWDFQSPPILTASSDPTPTLESRYTAWITQNRATIAEMKRLEEENNRLLINAYGLQDELTPEVPIDQITLTVNPAYRYGGKLTEEEQWTRFRQDTMQELVSYAIGCMMGRYSLDAPGLIYAHSGNEGFDPGRYTRFPADADGIIPLTDTDWFDDDAARRVSELISVAWNAAHLEENLSFLADNLSPKKNESSRETLRRYLCDGFFKDHLQTYKNRPIYWCFTSGKQKAFQCLVYLHRHHQGTLARMRMEYVVPLQSKMAARIDTLADDIQAAGSGAQAKRLQKARDKLTRQLEELRRFDEQLRHYADLRIGLDLDDGVKVNYARFGDLLAEVKAVTGQKGD